MISRETTTFQNDFSIIRKRKICWDVYVNDLSFECCQNDIKIMDGKPSETMRCEGLQCELDELFLHQHNRTTVPPYMTYSKKLPSSILLSLR